MRIRLLDFGVAALLALFSCSFAAAQTPALQVNVLYECDASESLKILSCSGPAGSAICDLQAYQGGQPALRVSMPQQEIATLLLPKCHLQTAAEAKAHPQSSALIASVNGTSGAPLVTQSDATLANGLKQDEGQRALARCIASGRLPASCTGNTLLGGFTQMISQVLPSAAKESAPGPNMAGVFQGAGGWRLDFFDGVLVSCASLAPDHHNYTLDFKAGRPIITIDTAPKPLVLTLKEDGTITGPGPFVIDGVVVTGYTSGGTASSLYKDQFGNPVDVLGNRIYAAAPQPIFGPRRATCSVLNLSSQGAGVGMAMQTDVLKAIFGGDKGAPTPPGIRMHGIFAATTGFSAEFFPESVVLGCGPDAARAYPYAVVADGARPAIKIGAPDHPLNLALRSDGSLDAGSGPYQVHGRTLIGQNDNGGFNFAPLEQTCNLAVLTPSKQIPAGGGIVAPGQTAGPLAAAAPQVAVASAPIAKASPAAGNAVLSLVGFPNAGGANPLTGHAFFLLKDSFDNVLLKGGVQPLAGKTPMQSWMLACDQSAAICRQAMANMGAYTAAVVRMDAAGKGTFAEVPPGAYYLFGSGVVNGKPTAWSFPVRLTPGQNSVTIDRSNAAQF